MTITLCKITDEAVKLAKTVSTVKNTTGTLKESTSILNPTVLLNAGMNDITGSNYMYIPEFKRYYFIKNANSVRSNLWEITGHVDVLTTYKDEILNNHAIISRNENEFDLKLNDGVFKTLQNPRIGQYSFPYGFNTTAFVLALSGD